MRSSWILLSWHTYCIEGKVEPFLPPSQSIGGLLKNQCTRQRTVLFKIEPSAGGMRCIAFSILRLEQRSMTYKHGLCTRHIQKAISFRGFRNYNACHALSNGLNKKEDSLYLSIHAVTYHVGLEWYTRHAGLFLVPGKHIMTGGMTDSQLLLSFQAIVKFPQPHLWL